MFHSEYFGVYIRRSAPNNMGMRYEAYAPKRLVRADTLAGIRRMIREYR